jgi:hypothetical protein
MARLRRAAARPPGPAHPSPELAVAEQLLATLGAVRFVVPRGFWVYVLFEDEARARPFYVGMSGQVLGRLGTHADNHAARLADIWVIPCRDEHQARVTQIFLIDRLEGPLINVLGTAQYENYRREARRRARYLDSPEHVARTMRPDHLPA